VRIAIEERAAFSSDALTGMEASLRFCWSRNDRIEDFCAALGVAKLDFSEI